MVQSGSTVLANKHQGHKDPGVDAMGDDRRPMIALGDDIRHSVSNPFRLFLLCLQMAEQYKCGDLRLMTYFDQENAHRTRGAKDVD